VLPEPLGIIAGTAIGVILVAAGASKLSSVVQWRASARDMGVATWISGLVPWVEIVLGGVVIARIALPWSAWAVVAVLVGFTVVILRQLLRGYRPGCGCFGQRSATPLGARHVIRNAIFVVVGVLAAIG
jgi:hypothetical protein